MLGVCSCVLAMLGACSCVIALGVQDVCQSLNLLFSCSLGSLCDFQQVHVGMQTSKELTQLTSNNSTRVRRKFGEFSDLNSDFGESAEIPEKLPKQTIML